MSAGPEGLDARFGTCGVLTPALLGTDSAADRLARAPDGSVIAAGSAGDLLSRKSVALTRITAAGTVDASFGTGGVAKFESNATSGPDPHVTGLVVQPDGKIVVGGYVSDGPAFLLRADANGDLDPAFGSGGVVGNALPASRGSELKGIALTGDGAIVAAGWTDDRPSASGDRETRFTVARFRSDGSRDAGFAGGGVTTVDPGLGQGQANAVELQPDGRIVAAGRAGEQFALVRLLANGEPDPEFGKDGGVYDSPAGSAQATSLALLPDGRIVVSGTVSNVVGIDVPVLARYSAQGDPDPTFGRSGFAIDRRATGPGAVAVDDAGRLVVAASFAFNSAGLVRHRADGSRDVGFGLDGALARDGASAGPAPELLVEPDGTVLEPLNIGFRFGIARFAASGQALADTADQAPPCAGRITTGRLLDMLEPGKLFRHGRLRVALSMRQPGVAHLSVSARVGGRAAPIGATDAFFLSIGNGKAVIPVSRTGSRFLRRARSAEITVTAQRPDGGGGAFAFTRTLRR